jgi:hypothetical protein
LFKIQLVSRATAGSEKNKVGHIGIDCLVTMGLSTFAVQEKVREQLQLQGARGIEVSEQRYSSVVCRSKGSNMAAEDHFLGRFS